MKPHLHEATGSPTVRRRDIESVADFQQALADNLYYTRGQPVYTATDIDRFMTLCYTVRDQLVRRWQKTEKAYFEKNPRTVYYLSAEYLLGEQLRQNLLYTGLTETAAQAMREFGHDPEALLAKDREPGLGNGGLGRLAACFLDSLATLGLPCVAYGIRYEFGIFEQLFRDGWQFERPDDWLFLGNPWEFPQPDDIVTVNFGGYTESYLDEQGKQRRRWVPEQTVLGEPYHMLVPGYQSPVVNLLRLWRARASHEFNFQVFDEGDFHRAVAQKVESETISKVLYPNDNTPQGRELRLRQQYFFVACSLADMLRIFLTCNDGLEQLPEKAVVQLNDTHPVMAIPELMRLLVDEHGLEWDQAWSITTRTFASTQHTLLPEALERWPVRLLENVLPRHLEIIYEINHRFLQEVARRYPGDHARQARMSLIEEGPDKLVRMAYLACVGSFSVNGVAELQSRLLAERVLNDFAEMWPEKFNNKTNGVSPRRFMRLSNPALSELLTSHLGEDWLNHLDRLEGLKKLAGKATFRKAWRAVKMANKRRLTDHIGLQLGLEVDPESMFDVMVKRLHEYKRQVLKVLHIITLYQRWLDDPEAETVPRTFIFGAKAAPGYRMAKLIIKLINSVAEVVNETPSLRVAFLPNFNVSLGEVIYPAADLSEQISLAGKEASGTGNMKLALNGALTVGTLDGANVEIRDLVGEENFFLFGLTTEEVFALKASGYNPGHYYSSDGELARAIDSIARGDFGHHFGELVDSLLHHDEYLVLADYRSYVEVQDQVDRHFCQVEDWTRKSILNVASCGFFSSDRTIGEYSRDIWHLEPLLVD
ncbi:MAG: glycogen/starch/alpha-glucan phosphorylase [Vulcanimicrobiota bacterium]